MCTEMVSAKAVLYNNKNTEDLMKTVPGERPLALQLFGSEPEIMADIAKRLSEREFDIIDVNMGCPVHKVVSNGEGSALMKDPAAAAAIVRAVCAATSLPVTVKIRAGWDRAHINAPQMAKYLEDAGASMICVHARTREQMYEPGIDLSVIARVKEAVRIPVVGNGDIRTGADALKMFRETGCDGVMIGRGALGNPWIFTEIAAACKGVPYTPPSMREKMQVALRQVRAMVAQKGEHTGVAEGRKHLAWYIRDLPGAAALRNRVMRAEDLATFETIIAEVSQSFADVTERENEVRQ